MNKKKKPKLMDSSGKVNSEVNSKLVMEGGCSTAEEPKAECHNTHVFAEAAVRYLKSEAKHGKPFFLYIAFTAPHDPLVCPEEFLPLDSEVEPFVVRNFKTHHMFGKRGLGSGLGLPAIFHPPPAIHPLAIYPPTHPLTHPLTLPLTEPPEIEGVQYVNPEGKGFGNRDEEIDLPPRNRANVTQRTKDYMGVIRHMDHHVGRILAELRSSQFANETYVIFTSDHGTALGSHGLISKQSNYEHSIRIPMLISGPDVQHRRIPSSVYPQDIVRTLAAMCGAGALNAPALDGDTAVGGGFATLDLTSALLDADYNISQNPRQYLFSAFMSSVRSVSGRVRGMAHAVYPFVHSTHWRTPPHTSAQVYEANSGLKLITYHSTQGKKRVAAQLFDVLNDVDETNNLLLPSNSTDSNEKSDIHEHAKR